jgi:ribokinase
MTCPAKIVVVGSYGVGMTMYLERAPLDGETVQAHDFVQGPGGKGSNQAIAASRLGAEVALCSIVGPDALGAEARRLWEHERVDATAVLTGRGPTMVGFILVERSGANRIAISPGALLELRPGDIERRRQVIADADVLLVSLEIPLDAAATALRIAQDYGTLAVLDPAPATPEAADLLALADHFTPNRTEAATIAGLDPGAAAADQLAALRRLAPSAVIALTMATDGVLLADGDAPPVHVPALTPSRIVDTAGAGDAFTAAYAVALGSGRQPAEAAQLGCVAGAFAVEHREVVPGLPTREQLLTLARDAGVHMTTGESQWPT